jgi:redox-sensitive bicupin YhaK (pirin superfamily)
MLQPFAIELQVAIEAQQAAWSSLYWKDAGRLHSRHTFSFAGYHDPQRMQFGKLRVLTHDVVEAGAGFDMHLHDNMQIASIPLAGTLRHRHSMGNEHVIHVGEVQIMSSGTGITQSEYNEPQTEPVNHWGRETVLVSAALNGCHFTRVAGPGRCCSRC